MTWRGGREKGGERKGRKGAEGRGSFFPIRIYIFGNLTMNSEYLIIKSYSVIGHNWSSTSLFI
jgi:hypothetical protein